MRRISMQNNTLLDPQKSEVDIDIDDEQINDLYCNRLLSQTKSLSRSIVTSLTVSGWTDTY